MDESNKDRNKETPWPAGNYGIGTVGNTAHRFPLWYLKTRNAILYILGIIEILLAFRFAFKLLGANPASGFVGFIYALSGILNAPFLGIFRPYTSKGLVSSSIFEPSVIVAMMVYALVAWGIIQLIKIKAVREDHL